IIRADGSLKMHQLFNAMLRSFDIEDLETLWKLVKARFKSTKPVEYLDLILSGNWKIMFEPLTAGESMHIYMLIDKRYPLKSSTIQEMFNKKLQADDWNEMCYQLLKLLTKQLKGQ
ncbi:hypothetical protein Tco_1542119, partial [Tanacetum coccineum]